MRSPASWGQGGAQGITVQEVIERGIGDGPSLLVVDGAAGRGDEFGKVERRVGLLAAVVDQAPHHGVILPRLGRGGNGEQ
jgi:hypothetical protein